MEISFLLIILFTTRVLLYPMESKSYYKIVISLQKRLEKVKRIFYGYYLKEVFLSPSGVRIGGFIKYFKYRVGDLIVGLWNAEDGQIIFREFSPEEQGIFQSEPYQSPNVEPKPIEMWFSKRRPFLSRTRF